MERNRVYELLQQALNELPVERVRCEPCSFDTVGRIVIWTEQPASEQVRNQVIYKLGEALAATDWRARNICSSQGHKSIVTATIVQEV